MREVSQTEAIQTLPALLEEVKTHALIIRDGENGEGLGALVSMDDLQIIREARMARFEKLSREVYATIRANAEARGENVDEVIDYLVCRDDEV